MDEREQQRKIRHRLAVLRHADEVSGSISATCRYYGISRQVFYKWRRRFEEGGEEGLRPNGPAQPGHRLPEAFPECSACRATCLNRSSPNGRADDESCVPTADNGSVSYVTTEFAA